MPWDNNNGGPWGGGGDNGGSRGGPWGSGPKKPGGGSQPPDLEELLKKSQDRLKNVLPSGGNNAVIGGILVALLVVFWLIQSFYIVEPNELGQELVFGKPKDTVSQPGLNFHFWPVETVVIVSTSQQQTRIGSSGSRRGTADASLMLSGDQNIVDVVFTVLWRVSSPKDYLFNVREPDGFVDLIAESAMREFIGRSRAEDVRTERRAEVEDEVRTQLQKTLDEYGAGISIVGIQLERADPPTEVADAFEEVQRAQQDQERFQREAEQYANKLLGDARGEASKIREAAEGYKQSTIAQAEGEAARFLSVLAEYDKAKDVTRKRLYLETLERVLKDSNKVILESGPGGSGVVPYLPLNELQRRSNQEASQ